MPRTGQGVARGFGMDFAEHRSAELDIHDAEGFDLILTMGRDQARDVIAENPSLRPRVFTLKQFSRWIEDHPIPAGWELREWLDDHAAERPSSDFIGIDRRDDVADPLNGPAAAWVDMVNDLSRHLAKIIHGITSRAEQ